MSTYQLLTNGAQIFINRALVHLHQADAQRASEELWGASEYAVRTISQWCGLPDSTPSVLADNVAIFAKDSGDTALEELFATALALRPTQTDVSDWRRAEQGDVDQIVDLVSRLNRLAGGYVITPIWAATSSQQRPQDFTEEEKGRITATVRNRLGKYVDFPISVDEILAERKADADGDPYTYINVLFTCLREPMPPGIFLTFRTADQQDIYDAGAVGTIVYSFNDTNEYQQVVQTIAQGSLPKVTR